ncbi:structural protein [Cellulophaga phage phi40:1]|uniref:Structural protein n=1 Tax=Cellulophaga phage phi38:1 TaxID=1327977 RepID=R9ZXZ6_9CAUD|nr:virion structural protein [Cellulophaga phage phi38:1]AGO47964.1 structural protein [Cellulophaga phage phi40:1]AGO48129.1 structural protein [Cellulophaga phage phi38:1]
MGVGAAAAGLSAVGGIVKGINGAKRARKAQKAIDNYERQTLENSYKDMEVSTLGADLQREELARATATSVGALASGGVRGIIGGVGAVQANNVASSRAIGADLDSQQKNIDQLRASDNSVIRNMTETREQQDLAGLGNALEVGRQDAASGFGDAIQSVGSMGGILGGAKGATAAVGGGSSFSNPFASTKTFLDNHQNPFK